MKGSINPLAESHKNALLWQEYNLLAEEINFIQKNIELFPKGSVQMDLDPNIVGLYKVVKGFNFNGTGYDKQIVKKTVSENNKLVLKQYKLMLEGIKMGRTSNLTQDSSALISYKTKLR